MKTKILILITIFIFISCGSDDQYASVTTFSNSDYEFMPTHYENKKTVTFNSNLDNEITLTISAYNLDYEEGGGYSFGAGYSDKYLIHNLTVILDFIMEDCYASYIRIELIKNNEDLIKTTTYIPTSCNNLSSEIFYDTKNEATETMEFNNFTYTKVKILANSNHYLIRENSSIDKIYYDFNYGIIGFDDTTNGEYFRLVTD